MERTLEIIAVSDTQAVVRGERRSACGGCAGEKACATLGSWSSAPVELTVDNPLHAEVGDRVVVALPDGAIGRTAFRLYALPLLLFVLAGGSIELLLSPSRWAPLAAFLFGIVAIALYFRRLWSRRDHSDAQSRPTIVRHADPCPPPPGAGLAS